MWRRSGTLQVVVDQVAPARAREQASRALSLLPSSSRLQGLVAVVTVLGLFAALFALCRGVDQRADRGRPMYRDVLAMAWVQHILLKDGEGIVPADL